MERVLVRSARRGAGKGLRPFVATILPKLVALVLRLSGRRAGIVLVYHAVAERGGDPRRELVPAHGSALFAAHLEYLTGSFRVVALASLQEAVAARRRGDAFPVALTFDDDLPSHAHSALPALRRHAAPATFFLCGTLDRPRAFWWQRLQRAVDLGVGPFADEDIHVSAARIEALPSEERRVVEAELEQAVGTEDREVGLPEADVRELVGAGFEIGFHTVHHHRLTGLSDEALADAMTEGRGALEAITGTPLTAIAYPHGKADARVAAAAEAAGFRVGCTGRNEPVLPASAPLLLGRVEPSHRSLAFLAIQLGRVLAGRSQR